MTPAIWWRLLAAEHRRWQGRTDANVRWMLRRAREAERLALTR